MLILVGDMKPNSNGQATAPSPSCSTHYSGNVWCPSSLKVIFNLHFRLNFCRHTFTELYYFSNGSAVTSLIPDFITIGTHGWMALELYQAMVLDRVLAATPQDLPHMMGTCRSTINTLQNLANSGVNITMLIQRYSLFSLQI